MKYKIPKGSVQETFMIPLYGRKLGMDLYTIRRAVTVPECKYRGRTAGRVHLQVLRPHERKGLPICGYLLSLEDRKTYQCYSSCTTIGPAVGLSQNTVSKYIGMLAEKRLITVEPTIETTAATTHKRQLTLHLIPFFDGLASEKAPVFGNEVFFSTLKSLKKFVKQSKTT